MYRDSYLKTLKEKLRNMWTGMGTGPSMGAM